MQIKITGLTEHGKTRKIETIKRARVSFVPRLNEDVYSTVQERPVMSLKHAKLLVDGLAEGVVEHTRRTLHPTANLTELGESFVFTVVPEADSDVSGPSAVTLAILAARRGLHPDDLLAVALLLDHGPLREAVNLMTTAGL